MDTGDLGSEVLVADLAAAGSAPQVFVVGGRGDLNTEPDKLGADRLDTPPQTVGAVSMALMLGDEPADQWCGRSSSAAKKADAVFKMALALRNSAFSLRSFFSSADSSVVVPGRAPAST